MVGLGPGARDLMTPAVQRELEQAEDILGYETYVRMAGPFRTGQTIHMTDNREEMQRARHAFALAASGHNVAMVSSGDPGVFAMAAAVVEALHESDNPAWHGVELSIQPGISAAMAAASRIGAPLGHDFCIISLSDNLKPWDIIENGWRLPPKPISPWPSIIRSQKRARTSLAARWNSCANTAPAKHPSFWGATSAELERQPA